MTCNDCQELLPLLFAEALTESEQRFVGEHLKSCEDCKSMFERERAFFEISMTNKPASPLADHPDVLLLDSYVFNKPCLSPQQIREIASHLLECDFCRDLVDAEHKLPKGLDELLSPQELPLLTQMEETGSRKTNIIAIGRQLFWRPLAGYAAAAAILLVAVLTRPSSVEEPNAVVHGTIPSVLRGGESIIVFESPTQPCYLDMKYHVSPEPGHRYDIEVRPNGSGIPSQVFREFTSFDLQGNAAFRVLLDTGSYQLLLFDISDDDTIRSVRKFDLRLNTE